MTTYTSRGVPLAQGTDPANIADRVNPVAQLAHDRPGVATVTTVQRDALAGVELWDGRVVANITTDRLERYDAGTTTWRPLAESADLVTQTQAQAESNTDVLPRLTTGQRLYQAIAKWAVLLAGNQTVAGVKTFTSTPTVNGTAVVVTSDVRLDAQTQAQAESSTDLNERLTTGQRLYQAIAKWAVLLAGNQTVAGVKTFTSTPTVNGTAVVTSTDARLAAMTQAEAESNSSTVAGTATGQRLYQAIAKWAMTLAGTQTVTGAKNFTGGLQASGSPVLADSDLSSTAPLPAADVAAPGVSGQVARRDHVHPIAASTPRGVLGYAQVTANQGSITNEVDLSGLAVAVAVGTSRRIRITIEASPASTVANDVATLTIKEGATRLQARDAHLPVGGATGSVVASVVLTPTAGTHTYKATMLRGSGSGTIVMNAASTRPAYILVEDIGDV